MKYATNRGCKDHGPDAQHIHVELLVSAKEGVNRRAE